MARPPESFVFEANLLTRHSSQLWEGALGDHPMPGMRCTLPSPARVQPAWISYLPTSFEKPNHLVGSPWADSPWGLGAALLEGGDLGPGPSCPEGICGSGSGWGGAAPWSVRCSGQPSPVRPGQQRQASSVTVLWPTLYLGLSTVWYLGQGQGKDRPCTCGLRLLLLAGDLVPSLVFGATLRHSYKTWMSPNLHTNTRVLLFPVLKVRGLWSGSRPCRGLEIG